MGGNELRMDSLGNELNVTFANSQVDELLTVTLCDPTG